MRFLTPLDPPHTKPALGGRDPSRNATMSYNLTDNFYLTDLTRVCWTGSIASSFRGHVAVGPPWQPCGAHRL